MKYAVLLTIFAGLYVWGDWKAVGISLAILLPLSIAVHLLFRWKTNAWTRSWGPYKTMTLPEDDQHSSTRN